ncbi:hypothetical protein AAU57_11110 [Nonlabens sp. YIK11]|uniref:GAF domain-containing sensor histidine kinase n=1 Tax=Nonlabens sp. YIK11 TaxID=1453349 RepID=UPI0006DD35AB|nr:GAF domain-containing sensor histidine kinase [Nonlabens sp. YIK11]KQC33815.1 hypothetical protein AAU57_11110 [Nonlabens sp. YIK11]
MTPAPLHHLEDDRLKYLNSFVVQPEVPTEDLDQLLDVACRLLGIPKGLISIVERDVVHFKSQYGFNLPPAPRNLSFCSHAIASDQDVFYIEDTRLHPYFKHHPYVKAEDPVIFYAGVPMMDSENLPLGTVCVIDNKPRKLSEEQKDSLKMISQLIMRQMQLRKEKLKLEKKQTVLKEKNAMLKNFAHVVSHDMKMPLANMIMTSDVIRQKYADKLDAAGVNYLTGIKSAAFSMRDYIDNILTHYESEHMVINTGDKFDIHTVLLNIEEMLGMRQDFIQFLLPEENMEMQCDESAVEQVLVNLVGNSLKYNHRESIRIQVTATECDKYYRISVIDNGIGIPEAKQKEVFKLFTTLNQADRSGKIGHGIGLSTVKILVDKLGGVIKCKSTLNVGTTFTFTVAKHVGQS